jgi:hypothetical protein
MRNTQNISIIRPEPPAVAHDETTWSLSGAAVGFISWLLALGIPSSCMAVIRFFPPLHLALFSRLNAGCRGGWDCAALAVER